MSPRQRRTSPEDAQKIAAYAGQLPCHNCGAVPGSPCTEPGSGRSTCKSRFAAAAIALSQQAKAARRTPEQAAELAAILAGLPRLTREEVEAGRTRPAVSLAPSSPHGGCRGRRHPDGSRPSCAVRTAAMTTDPALLTRAERARLLERVRELDELAGFMRQPGGLAEAPEPAPLHRNRRYAGAEEER